MFVIYFEAVRQLEEDISADWMFPGYLKTPVSGV